MAPLSPPTFRRKDLEHLFAAVEPVVSSRLQALRSSERAAAFARETLAAAFATMGARLTAHRNKRAETIRLHAPLFNVFDFIKPTENILSDVLLTLLEPGGSHGQGGLFLCLLLQRLQPGGIFQSEKAVTAREAPTYTLPQAARRRIDLVITMPSSILAVENKKFTGEGVKQIHDYCAHLRNVAGDRFCLIFLTREGFEAQSLAPELRAEYKRKGQLVSWSWEKDIPAWLQECRSQCQSDKIRHFLTDFEHYITTYLATVQALPETDESPS